jgi:hypothetical protein
MRMNSARVSVVIACLAFVTIGDRARVDAQGLVAEGAGISDQYAVPLRQEIYSATIGYAQFVTAAVTSDVIILTMQPRTKVLAVYAYVGDEFACGAVCTTSTLSIQVGVSGASEFLASFDADAAKILVGDADAELGTEMTRAAAVQGGYIPSWASETEMTLRLTSGTGNIGNGSVTNLSAGEVTFYVIVTQLP